MGSYWSAYQPYNMPSPGPGQSSSTWTNPWAAIASTQIQGPFQTFNAIDGYPVQCFTLRNGHRLIIEQRPTDIISLRTYVNAGSINEDPLNRSPYYSKTGFPTGIAHLDEHCHFLQTRNFPQINKWTQTVSQAGATLNASTGDEVIQHQLTFNREDLPFMLAMHAESVLRPKYEDAKISQEKKNVINEMGQRTNDPFSKLTYKLSHLMNDRSGLQTLGSEQDVMGTTAEQLRRFHRTVYTPDNMVTVISGRVDPQLVYAITDREFGNNPPAGPQPQRALKLALQPGQIRHATLYDPTITFSMVKIGFPGPSAQNLRERVTLECIASILNGGENALLETELKNRQQLITSYSAGVVPQKQTGYFGIGLETKPGMEQQAASAAVQLVSQLGRYGVAPHKLKEAQNRLLHSFRNRMLSAELRTELMGNEALNNTLSYYRDYERIVQSITAWDVLSVAQKYLNPNTYAVVYMAPGRNKPTTLNARGGKAAWI